MRILCITHYFPWPADAGGPIRVLGLLRALAQEHEVQLLTIRRDGTTEADRAVLRSAGIEVEDFPAPPEPHGGAGLWGRSIVHRKPPWVLADESQALCRRALALAPAYDAIVIMDDHAAASAELLRAAGTPRIVLDKPIVLGADPFPNRKAGTRERLVRALGSRLEQSFEGRCLRSADAAVVTSEEEGERLQRIYGRAPNAVVPSAIDLPARPSDGANPRRIGWLGSMDGEPIVNGLVRFVRSAWEPLGSKGYELLVGGREPPKAVRDLERHPGVHVLGYVDDLDGFLKGLGAAVVPLWGGQGVKLKTLTFLGAGLPTAATPVALEGIPAEDGRHCLVADPPQALALALERIAADPQLARHLADNARRLVAQQFSWEHVGPRFVEVVERAAAS